jgi:hypothetical protein
MLAAWSSIRWRAADRAIQNPLKIWLDRTGLVL